MGRNSLQGTAVIDIASYADDNQMKGNTDKCHLHQNLNSGIL